MSGVAVVTKRNLVSEAILFVFIVLQADVTNPDFATIESAEHIFEMRRTAAREFIMMEFVQIAEKVTHCPVSLSCFALLASNHGVILLELLCSSM